MVRKLILCINLIAPVAAVVILFSGGRWWWALGVLMLAHALWLWATLVPGCTWWGPQFKRLPGDEREVWLTIDDGPDPADTPALLDLLDRHGARATFFVIGDKAARHAELTQQIVARGHELGDHTFHHPAKWFWFLGRGRIEMEIKKGLGAIRRAAPEAKVRWFRAPAGMRNHHVHPVLREVGLDLAGWSVRGRDGVSTDSGAILTRLKKGARPGAVILMHEGRVDDKGRRLAPQVLEALLEHLRAENLRCVLP